MDVFLFPVACARPFSSTTRMCRLAASSYNGRHHRHSQRMCKAQCSSGRPPFHVVWNIGPLSEQPYLQVKLPLPPCRLFFGFSVKRHDLQHPRHVWCVHRQGLLKYVPGLLPVTCTTRALPKLKSDLRATRAIRTPWPHHHASYLLKLLCPMHHSQHRHVALWMAPCSCHPTQPRIPGSPMSLSAMRGHLDSQPHAGMY